MALINQKAWIKKRPKQIKDIIYMMYQYNGGGYTSNYYSVNLNSNLLAHALGYQSVVEFDANEDVYGKSLKELFFSYLPYSVYHFNPLPFQVGYPNPRVYTQADISLYTLFGERTINPNMFPYLETWDGTREDYEYIYNQIIGNVCACIRQNYYKWKNMLKSCLLEFNPLWNVDGTEETTRTLEQDGTVVNAKRGTDSSAHDETNRLVKTGSDTNKKSGNDIIAKTGTEDFDATNESTTQNSGTDVEILARTTTESTTFYDAERNTKNNGLKVATGESKDERSTYNLSDTTTYDSTNTLTHNTTDAETKDHDTINTYNTDDTMTRDLIDTEIILHERHGNIGVTTTTKLLTEFREYVSINLLKLIVHDIANYISLEVY